MSDKPKIRLAFNSHGLGDVVHGATAMRLYVNQGYDVQIQVENNKRWIWKAAGIPIYDGPDRLPAHPYVYPDGFWDLDRPDHLCSKIAHFFEHPGLPELGSKSDVWRMVCSEVCDATPAIPDDAHAEAESFLAGMPRPIFAIHSRGTNWGDEKSIPTDAAFNTIATLLKITAGSVIVLDFDCRAPMVGDARCKGIKPSWGHIGIDRLCALLQRCDLMIGVDSGPFHVAGMVPTLKTLGVFRKIPPVRCCVPSPNATYLVPDKDHKHWAKRTNQWQFLEYGGDCPSGEEIAEHAERLVSGREIVPMTLERLKSVAGLYTYRRVGYDERPIELLDNGTVGIGAAGCERKWHPEPCQNGWRIAVTGDKGDVRFRLEMFDDGILRGRWLHAEEMPIELIPQGARTTGKSSGPAQESVALVERHGVMVRSGYAHSQDMDVVREVVLEDSYHLALRESYGANEVVVDVGSHIGTFAVMWHKKNPAARLICIEACPENIPVLTANVGAFATIIHAACSYEPGELALLNSVKPDGTATGGSTVVPRSDILKGVPFGHAYWDDMRPLRKVTLEEAMQEAGVDHIDVLKMDCEGSEFSIIENSPTIPSVKFMCGEYHGQARWDEVRARVLPDWSYGHMWASNDLGIFHLENPRFKPASY